MCTCMFTTVLTAGLLTVAWIQNKMFLEIRRMAVNTLVIDGGCAEDTGFKKTNQKYNPENDGKRSNLDQGRHFSKLLNFPFGFGDSSVESKVQNC